MSSVDLPSGWIVATASDICEKIQDGTHFSPKQQLTVGKYRYITAKNVRPEGLDLSHVKFLTEQDHRAIFRRCDPRRGDVLLVKDGVNAGDAAINTLDEQISLLSSVCFLRPHADTIDGAFLRYYLLSPAASERLAGKLTGTAIRRIVLHRVKALPVHVAPREEQRRIVDAIDSYFSRLNDAITTLERAQRNLKRYRASVLKAAVEGRLVPTEAELARAEGRDYEPASVLLERVLVERRRRWEEAGRRGKYEAPVAPDTTTLPDLPEGWCWATIEQLASADPRSIQSGPFGSNLRHSEFRSAGRLVIGIDNVQEGFFSIGANHRVSEEKFVQLEKYRARPGDFLITVMATIGRCCVVPNDIEPAIVSKHVYRVTVERRILMPHYLRLAMWGGPIVRAQMFRQAQGQTRLGLNGTIIKRLAIPLPPLGEQERIISEADRLLSVGDRVATSLAATAMRCTRLRQSILKWAFKGRLADQDPNDEPTSVLLERIKAERAAVTVTKRIHLANRCARKTA